MIKLIKKDIRFSIKYIIITLAYSIGLPIFLMFDEDKSAINLLSYLIPIVTLGLIIGKICYVEDSDDIKMFLKSLPYKNSNLIICKFVELFFLDLISIIYVTTVQIYFNLYNSIEKVIQMNIISGSSILLYYSIYLFLYFKKNYNVAQNTIYILVAFIMGLIFFTNKVSPSFISEYSYFNINYIVIVVFLLSIIIYFICIRALIKKTK